MTTEPPPDGTAHAGRCLCGAIAYEVRGPLRSVVVCHCGECRRWHGSAASFTSARREDLVVADDRTLRWVESPASRTQARRAFCDACGSSLFWAAPGRETISIAAGTLDVPTGLVTTRHIYVADASDYEDLPPADGPEA